MKCYIATFYQYNNYGTRLQNLALCQTIRTLGAEPVTLVIDEPKEKLKGWIKDLLSYLPAVSDKQHRWLNDRKKRDVFQNFIQRLSCLKLTYDELGQLDFSDAIAVAGSDQIWSPAHLLTRRQDAEFYFLRFAPEERRYTYAPSFGIEEIPDKMKSMYQTFLSEMKCVSIREKSGQMMICSLIEKKVPVLPDPVFLLSKEEWKNMVQHTDFAIPEKDYIVIYFLSRQKETVWNGIKEYAHDINAKIIPIAGTYLGKDEMIPTPDMFVNLIGHAQAVFTDSFHGAAFSIIMQVPFIIFHRTDVDQSTRLHMLLEKYECSSCLFFDEKENNYTRLFSNHLWNLEKTEQIIVEERKRGLDYLEHFILDQ